MPVLQEEAYSSLGNAVLTCRQTSHTSLEGSVSITEFLSVPHSSHITTLSSWTYQSISSLRQFYLLVSSSLPKTKLRTLSRQALCIWLRLEANDLLPSGISDKNIYIHTFFSYQKEWLCNWWTFSCTQQIFLTVFGWLYWTSNSTVQGLRWWSLWIRWYWFCYTVTILNKVPFCYFLYTYIASQNTNKKRWQC